jgi:hypothetical protein
MDKSGLGIYAPHWGQISELKYLLSSEQSRLDFTKQTIRDLVAGISQGQANLDGYSSCGRAPGGLDILTRGVLEMLDNGEVPIWLVLACQVHVDIYWVLSDDVGLVRRSLATLTGYSESFLEQLVKSQSNPSTKGQANDLTRWISDWLIPDLTPTIPTTVAENLNREIDEHYLLDRHSMLCGHLAVCLKNGIRNVALEACNESQIVVALLYIYNALSNEIPLLRREDDLDVLISLDRSKELFAGETPTARGEYVGGFRKAMNHRSKGHIGVQLGGELSTVASIPGGIHREFKGW